MAAHRHAFVWPVLYACVLSLAVAVGFLQSHAFPMDDHFLYEQFAESLSRGHLDLSIPGFHGSDFFVVPILWLTRSPISQIYLQVLCAVLLPIFAYWAGKAVLGRTDDALLFATCIALMPFLSFVALRGWTGPAYFCLFFGAIALARRSPVAAGLLWGFACLTKPFAIALFPLFLLWAWEDPRGWRRWIPLFAIPAGMGLLYFGIEIVQAGRIFIGAHPNLTPGTTVQGPLRIGMNAAQMVQILFSVHNYVPFHPELAGPGNMLHTTPVLLFLGVFALCSRRMKELSGWLKAALGAGVILGLLLTLPLDHVDHFYMETGVVLLMLAGIPLLRQERMFVLLALATLHFQWFYFYLNYGSVFGLGWVFFAVPALVDVAVVGMVVVWPRFALGWEALPSKDAE